MFTFGGRFANDRLLVLFHNGRLRHTNRNAGVTIMNVIRYYDHPTASIPNKLSVITKASYTIPTIIL